MDTLLPFTSKSKAIGLPESLVAERSSASWLIHVTVVAAGTVSVAGLYVYNLIMTVVAVLVGEVDTGVVVDGAAVVEIGRVDAGRVEIGGIDVVGAGVVEIGTVAAGIVEEGGDVAAVEGAAFLAE